MHYKKALSRTKLFVTAVIFTFLFSHHTMGKTDDMQVTDPNMLEMMGFEKDMTNVFVADGVNLQSFSSLKSLQDAPDNSSLKQLSLMSSGTTGYSPLSPKAFIGRIDTTGSQWLYSAGNGVELSRLGTEKFADAQFEGLPNDGELTFFRWWWSDNDENSSLSAFLFEVCQPSFGGGAITFTTVATSTSFDSANGSTVVTIPNRSIDTQSCYYLARVRFDAASSLLRLQKMRLQFIHP